MPWWSQKERGSIVSVWNRAHNVGGGIPPLLFLLGMAWFNDWKAAFYMPSFAAIAVALVAFASIHGRCLWPGRLFPGGDHRLRAAVLLRRLTMVSECRHKQQQAS